TSEDGHGDNCHDPAGGQKVSQQTEQPDTCRWDEDGIPGEEEGEDPTGDRTQSPPQERTHAHTDAENECRLAERIGDQVFTGSTECAQDGQITGALDGPDRQERNGYQCGYGIEETLHGSQGPLFRLVGRQTGK